MPASDQPVPRTMDVDVVRRVMEPVDLTWQHAARCRHLPALDRQPCRIAASSAAAINTGTPPARRAAAGRWSHSARRMRMCRSRVSHGRTVPSGSASKLASVLRRPPRSSLDALPPVRSDGAARRACQRRRAQLVGHILPCRIGARLQVQIAAVHHDQTGRPLGIAGAEVQHDVAAPRLPGDDRASPAQAGASAGPGRRPPCRSRTRRRVCRCAHDRAGRPHRRHGPQPGRCPATTVPCQGIGGQAVEQHEGPALARPVAHVEPERSGGLGVNCAFCRSEVIAACPLSVILNRSSCE